MTRSESARIAANERARVLGYKRCAAIASEGGKAFWALVRAGKLQPPRAKRPEIVNPSTED